MLAGRIRKTLLISSSLKGAVDCQLPKLMELRLVFALFAKPLSFPAVVRTIYKVQAFPFESVPQQLDKPLGYSVI
jgi:hypothetical protein